MRVKKDQFLSIPVLRLHFTINFCINSIEEFYHEIMSSFCNSFSFIRIHLVFDFIESNEEFSICCIFSCIGLSLSYINSFIMKFCSDFSGKKEGSTNAHSSYTIKFIRIK